MMSDETVESIPGEVKQSHYKVEIWGRKKDKDPKKDKDSEKDKFFDTFENAFVYCKQDLQDLCDGSLKEGGVRICKLIPFSSSKYHLPATNPSAKDAICYQEVFCCKSMNEGKNDE